MVHKLKQYFPTIRTRKEILEEIRGREELLSVFESWKESQQEEFLDFCTGVRGVKILYDSFFKEILSPEFHPERMERLLSLILGKSVKIKQILPNDSVRIADETTLLITDIVVELEDGSLANVEIQKIGYAFPGQRMACYSADMLLRQYKRVKSIRREKFTYRDMKTVYTIVLYEKSTGEFKEIPECYIHRSRQIFDSGLNLDTLQEYILIPLDIFRENTHNKTVENELDAWLTFISFDSPEKIIELIEGYPEFREIYGEVYDICRNVEGVMDMFSKELQELDRNTVQYMIEEQEKKIKDNQKQLEDSWKQLQDSQRKLEDSWKQLQDNQKQLENSQKLLQEKDKLLKETQERMRRLEERILELEKK